jgi:hypothetical protein
MEIREDGADERRNASGYWLGSLTWCVRCGASNTGMKKTDNFTGKNFEDINAEAHK